MAYHQGKAKEAELAAELDRTSAAQGGVSIAQPWFNPLVCPAVHLLCCSGFGTP